MTVSVVQTDLHWENVDANLVHFTELLETASPADLYVLPEMFTTGFSMAPERLAGESFSKGLTWMQKMAAGKNAALTGSLMAEDDGRFYNRLVFARPDGSAEFYDKKHMFSLGNEQLHYTAGAKKLIVEYNGWKICPMVCYDLRFPVWSRNTEDYDLLLYVANWPQKRAHHWRGLLVARAIENQCYVAGCNRAGTDGNNLEYSGSSMLVDFSGAILDEHVNSPAIFSATLSKEGLDTYRKSFPFLSDKDNFRLI
ncbi:MAG TPA: amidohydrolase [Bacteroidia bacterium]|nr:amidohydrolase [Bacteroidia bacterium]